MSTGNASEVAGAGRWLGDAELLREREEAADGNGHGSGHAFAAEGTPAVGLHEATGQLLEVRGRLKVRQAASAREGPEGGAMHALADLRNDDRIVTAEDARERYG